MYCPSLWKSVHIDTDGYLTPCCLFVGKDTKQIKITDVNNIETALVNDFQEHRTSMEQDIWPAGCNQCQFAEAEGRISKRQSDMWMSKKMKTPAQDVQLEYLQLKTGRLCNLKCTICGPQCSTAIATEHLNQGKLSRIMYDQYQKEIEWSYDIEQYNKMNSNVGYYRIDLAGGEPFMNKTHFKWLDSIANKETQLQYNTNGTFRPTRSEIDIWKKFKGVWLAFSIDSYKDKFEELRVGAKWNEVVSNLKYCQEEIFAKEFDANSHCSVVVTISKNNIFDVFKLYELLTSAVCFNHTHPINFNYLVYPDIMACHNMSKLELEQVIKLYDEQLLTLDKESVMYIQSKNLRDSMENFYVNLCKP
jgi:radical SAM protein with 4Fe4S-binding SPASM domain